jgi:hypothetical protein
VLRVRTQISGVNVATSGPGRLAAFFPFSFSFFFRFFVKCCCIILSSSRFPLLHFPSVARSRHDDDGLGGFAYNFGQESSVDF